MAGCVGCRQENENKQQYGNRGAVAYVVFGENFLVRRPAEGFEELDVHFEPEEWFFFPIVELGAVAEKVGGAFEPGGGYAETVISDSA